MARLLPALVLLALAGCGGGGGAVSARLTLLVPAPPAAAEAGAYLALDRGYDSDEGLRLDIKPVHRTRALRTDEAAVVPATAIAGDPQSVAVMAVTQGASPLVLAVPRTLLEDDRAEVAALIRALQRGYIETLADPDSAVAAMTTSVDGLDRAALSADLDRIAPSFTAGARGFGDLASLKLPPSVAVDRSLVGPVNRG